MKRRITSMLLAAAMTITMLTGCGSQGKETEKTDTGAIVLDMYHSWSTDSERGAALDKLIQEFNKEYEGKIEVKVTINPDFPAYQEKVKTMISTDTTPDIFHYNFNPNDLSRQKSGKLMDFSEYMKLFRCKRLGQVVVRAAVQPRHFVADFPFGGEQEHRRGDGSFAQPLQNR